MLERIEGFFDKLFPMNNYLASRIFCKVTRRFKEEICNMKKH